MDDTNSKWFQSNRKNFMVNAITVSFLDLPLVSSKFTGNLPVIYR